MTSTLPAWPARTVTVHAGPGGFPFALHDLGGSGDGPPLLLSHGNGLNVGMWAAALAGLTEHFRCFGLDLRGHGRAPVDAEGYPVDRASFASDVRAAIEVIGEPVRYAAHSLGAASAAVAAADDDSPFVGLWLFEPVLVPVGFDRGDQGPSFLIEISRRRRMDFASVDDAVARFRSKPPYATCDPVAVQGYVEVGTVATADGVRLSCRGEDEARVYEGQSEVDFTRLAAIGRPTVVVSGASVNEANALPPRLAPLVAEAIPGARWEEHAHLSHFGPMEDPSTVTRSIVDHFRSRGPAVP